MSDDIIAATITDYNTSNQPRVLTFRAQTETTLYSTSDYQACVYKMEVPINSKYMPINSTRESFRIIIFNEYKGGKIPALEYGINIFDIPGPIMSVKDFIKSINDIIFKKVMPVQLGQFILNKEHEISYVYDKKFADEHDNVRIYFDGKLRRLFAFPYDESDEIDGCWRFKAVSNFSPSADTTPITIESEEFTYPFFYNMKGFRIRTTLPIHSHMLFNGVSAPEPSNVLADIIFNSELMYNNRNFIYQPSNFFFSSMNEVGELKNFALMFNYYYADGTEIPIMLDSLDYASASLFFQRK